MLPMDVFSRIGAQSAVGIWYTIFKESKEAVSVSFGITGLRDTNFFLPSLPGFWQGQGFEPEAVFSENKKNHNPLSSLCHST